MASRARGNGGRGLHGCGRDVRDDSRDRDGSIRERHLRRVLGRPRFQSWNWLSPDEIKKREEINPDQVHQVPIQADVIDWAKVFGTKIAAQRTP